MSPVTIPLCEQLQLRRLVDEAKHRDGTDRGDTMKVLCPLAAFNDDGRSLYSRH